MSSPNKSPLTPFEESIGFYYELGLAITQWAHVELALYWVASTTFNTRERPKFALAFFSIDAFHNKLKVADRLFLKKHGKGKHKAKWPPIRQKLEALAKIRNYLAHYTVFSYPNAKPGRRQALIPRISGPSKFKQRVPLPPSEAMCIREINYARKRFYAAAFELEFLFYDLIGHKTPYPASFAQAGSAPSLEQVTLQIRSILSRPGEPSQA